MVDISKYYYDPKTGFTSAEKLHKKLAKIDPTVTLKEIKSFLKKQFTAQVNKDPKSFQTLFHHQLEIIFRLILLYMIVMLTIITNIYYVALMYIVVMQLVEQ